VAHPNLEPIREQHDQLRRLIQRSPFGHRVEVESANISVIAVKHLQRRPGYWQRRRRSGSPLSRPSFKIGFFESPLLFFTTILMTDKFCYRSQAEWGDFAERLTFEYGSVTSPL